MNKFIVAFLLAALPLGFTPAVFASGVNSDMVSVDIIKGRNIGPHRVFFRTLSGTAYTIPAQTPACSTSNFAVIDETDTGGQTQIALLMTAFSTGKTVRVWMDGCQESNPGVSSATAAKITQVTIYNDPNSTQP